MFLRERLRTAITEINSMRPNIILVTGDLTENGLISEFKLAQKELKKLKADKIVYLSGNHDYRSTGYLLFKEYFPFTQVTETDEAVIVVVSSARPDRDDGEIGNRQNLWLEKTLEEYKNKTRIVAIHHHVVPVPDTGADQITVVDAGDTLRSLVKSKPRTLRPPPQTMEMENLRTASRPRGQRILRKTRRSFLQLPQRSNRKQEKSRRQAENRQRRLRGFR
ncbi:metallophosphoesterase [Candidatus Bathyarchaeota archaeon]|nr:metallophosphoesterase [Candidatus Bathyarchaeota archaeon]